MTDSKHKLFLLDAMALIYRAHFAFSKNPRINSKGLNTGAQLGFTNTLLEILKKEKPSHIAVVFDTSAPTFRHEIFKEYKGHRPDTPEDIRTAIPMVKDIVRAFNIPVLQLDGYEADDIIGTIAKKASKEHFDVYMMTPDKDYAQLVDEHIFLYKPAYMGNGVDVLGIPEVLKKFDIEKVDQVRDILGLQGDASDNIPGIPGVGAKTAIKYLKAYGSLEGLLENTNDLKGKAKEKVIEFGEQGLLSKKLATIHIDVPIEFSYEQTKYEGPNEDALRSIFAELEFRTLMNRVFGASSYAKPSNLEQKEIAKYDASPKPKEVKKQEQGQLSMFGAPSYETEKSVENTDSEPKYVQEITRTIETRKHDYRLVDTLEKVEDLVFYLQKQEKICFDTETTSINPYEAELVGISFSYIESEAYYIPISEDTTETDKFLSILKPVFENEKITKIGQNIKYDLLILMNYGIQLKGKLLDTMLIHYLLEPDSRHNMDALSDNYLHYKPVSITELIGKKGKNQLSMRDIPIEKVTEYASEDADITLCLLHKLLPELNENLLSLYDTLEAPLVNVLASMESNGVNLDLEALKKLSATFEIKVKEIEKQIYDIVGYEFNIASPKQLGEILFDKLKIDDKPKKTATGQYATGEEILSKLAPKHEICQLILDYRGLQKLKSTYVDALPLLISKKDGFIHTSYNQAVTSTGRLSSTNPNLQNIPIRTPEGRLIREAFVPRSSEYRILAADYSQVELRIMAAFAEDEYMIQAFKEGKDIHSITASRVFNVDLEEVTSDMRRKAKTANFGIIYGISAFGLSQRLSIPRKEAAEIIENYFKEFPGVKNYMNKVVNDAKELGYVETLFGRRRTLRDINSKNPTVRGIAERNAINAPIQGTAADIIKKAMIEIHAWMEENKLKSKMILQVHDELVFDAHQTELDLLKTKIPEFMTAAGASLSVPLLVEVGEGNNWLEAH